MLKKILLALDGSENAEKALPWIRTLAGREKAQVVLFRVLPPDTDPQRRSQERRDAREYLQGIERELNFSGIPAKLDVRRGRSGQEIADAARDLGCDLIVLTTRGGSPVKRWVVGGTAEQVMRLSSVPVLPVPSRIDPPRHGHVRRLIVPLDGSKTADSAVWWSIAHVRPLGRERKGSLHFRTSDELNRRMNQMCDLLAEKGVRAEFRLQRGDAADRILKFADRNDLILTTTHGFGGVKRWVFGSVAEKLVHAGTTPVLVFKTPA